MRLRTAKALDKEPYHWDRAPRAAKSYLVCAFHQQHFKPSNLKRSWTKEETLTWEFFHALDILPRSMFLRRFLEAVTQVGPRQAEAAAPLLEDLSSVAWKAYPSLKLTGNKRNRRADLGAGFVDDPRIWIEVKTRPFNRSSLTKQLADECDALETQSRGPVAVVAIVPDSERASARRALTWTTVREVLSGGLADLEKLSVDPDLTRGYVRCARELIDRICAHDPRLVACVGFHNLGTPPARVFQNLSPL